MVKIVITESQLRKVVNNLFLEQDVVRTEKRTTASLQPPVKINYKWDKGLWGPKPELETNIQSEGKRILDFISKYKNQKITVTIRSGESRVTNKDNETTSGTFGQPLGKGQLANKRADTVKSLLNNLFQNAVSTGVIKSMPEFSKNVIVIGSTKYVRGTDNPDDEKYKNEQFVEISIDVAGENVEITEECLVGLKVMIDYKKAWCKRGQDESRCHQCDNAVFSIYANGLPLKDQRGNNVANLNNAGDGNDRSWIGVINAQDAKNILSKGNNEIIITYQCEDKGSAQGCHSDAMHVTITDSKNTQLFSNFVSGGYRVKPEDGQQFLLKTDKCGKVLSVAPTRTSSNQKVDPNTGQIIQQKPRTVKKAWSINPNDRIGSLAQLYAAVDQNTGKINPETLYDPVYDKSLYKQFSNLTWKDMKDRYSITNREEIAIQNRLKSSSTMATK